MPMLLDREDWQIEGGRQQFHIGELFFVHRGCLLMKFRDREETIEQGEFIVVPRGVEHCAVAVGGECEVLLATTTAPSAE